MSKKSGLAVPVLMLVISCTLPIETKADPAHQRSTGITPEGEIGFYVQGAETGNSVFAPQIVLAEGGTAAWTFTGYNGGHAEAATSDDVMPTANYSGPMLATLVVTPWSSLKGINLGYDGGDDGILASPYYTGGPWDAASSYAVPHGQNVTSVEHLELAKNSLEVWCSSHNNSLTALSFKDFSKLTTIESFYSYTESGGLVSIDLTRTVVLTRLCVENNNLAALDLSTCINLEDLRGAVNNYTSIIFPAVQPADSKIWHICIRDNPQMNQNLPLFSQFPSIKDLYIWNTNQSGDLIVNSTRLTEVRAGDNQYVSANFDNASFINNGKIFVHNNSLSSVSLEGTDNLWELNLKNNQLISLDLSKLGTPTLCRLDLSDNALTTDYIDAILAYLVSENISSEESIKYVKLEGGTNAPLSSAAQISKTTLVTAGWEVTDNGNQ